MRRTRGDSLRRAAAPAAVYAGLAALLTWPLLPGLRTHLGAPEGPGDPYLNLWILGWDLQALAERPWSVLDGRVFDANIFHPAAGTLAYSDHLLLQALLVLPVYLATRDPVVSYNALLLGSVIASGLAMHVCARGLGASRAGAYVAGIAWAFVPYRFAHLIHLQLQATYFLPLAVLLLAYLVAGLRARHAGGLGALAGLQAVSSFYYGVLTIVALPTLAAVLAVATGRWRKPRLAAMLVLAALVGAFVVAPVAWPYWQLQRQEGVGRNLYEAARHAAVPASYLQVPGYNDVYGRTRLLTARDGTGALRAGRAEGVEQALFPGFVLIGLAALGTWRWWRGASRPVALALLVLAALGAVLSLGPEGIRPVYAAFHRYVFGFQAVRAPARFGLLVVLALALLASRGVPAASRRRWLAVLCPVLLVVEYASVPLPLVERPPLTTPTGQWLASVPGPGAVVYLPLTNDRRNTVGMVESLQHRRPLLNGYSGLRPAFYPAVVDALSEFPSSTGLWTLKDLGVRFVVSPERLSADPAPAARAAGRLPLGGTPLVERAALPEGVIYELVWSDDAEAALAPPAPPAPPPPGPAPFTAGERAVYDVLWRGAGMGVPAGRATLEVAAATPPAVYRFVVTAETAPWVARFFEARDRFETAADARLFPLWHARVQRQGRRVVDRRYEYDLAEGTVRIAAAGGGSAPVTLRVPRWTRDALTTFYYVRTLPLAAGDDLELAVNDGGRNRVLTLRVAGRDAVVVGGRSAPALRLEPVIAERVPRREPPRLTIWLSDDARRIPLAAEIAAGFGRLRLELVDYRP